MNEILVRENSGDGSWATMSGENVNDLSTFPNYIIVVIVNFFIAIL